jgi:hypothetical protein
MQGDHARVLSDRSFKSLSNLFEVDSKLILTRLQDGLILSYKFQAEVFGVVKCMLLSEYSNFISCC